MSKDTPRDPETGQFTKNVLTSERARELQKLSTEAKKKNLTLKERLLQQAGYDDEKKAPPDLVAAINGVVDGKVSFFDRYMKYIGKSDDKEKSWSGRGRCPTCGYDPGMLKELDVKTAEELVDVMDDLEEYVKTALVTVNQLREREGLAMVSLSEFQYGEWEDYLP